jgi:Flp pilus assembly pilin Flp
MLKKLRNLFKDERGQDIIEYGLLASFISIAAVGVIKLIGPLIVPLYESVKAALT